MRIMIREQMLIIILCWSLLILPFPQTVFAQEPGGSFRTIVEVQDCSRLCQQIQTCSAVKGWLSPEMKAFSDPIKMQVSQSLDTIARELGIDIKALLNLFTGRVILEMDTDNQHFLLYAVPALPIEMAANIALFKQTLAQNRVTVKETDISGISVLSVRENNIFFELLYSTDRIVLSGSTRSNANAIIQKYFNTEVPVHNARLDLTAVYPKLAGEGLMVSGVQKMQFPETGGPDINSMVRAANIPGLNGRTASHTWIENDRIAGASFIEQDMSQGIAGLVKAGPLSSETLAWAHSSCQAVTGLRINFSGLPGVIKAIVDASGSPQISQVYPMIQAQFRMMFGVDFENGFFNTLGDEMLFVSYPAGKGGGFPVMSMLGLNAMAAIIKLQDPAAFSAAAARINTGLGSLAVYDTVNGGVRTVDHKGTAINYIKAFAGILSPCYAVKDGYLVLTLNVPLMRYVLDHAGTDSITADADFQKTLTDTGGPLTSGFMYQQPLKGDRANIMNSLGNPLAALAVVAILSSMLLPTLSRAREEGRRTACKNNLRQIGVALSMYAMTADEKLPARLEDMMPDIISDEMIFVCKSSGQSVNGYIYLPAISIDAPADIVVAFDRAGNHRGEGRNVLYLDAHVEWVSEWGFQELLQKMNQPEFIKHYTPEAVQTLQQVMQGAEPGLPDFVAEGGPVRPALDPDHIQQVLKTEARNIGSVIDFALFPQGDVFPAARKSNLSRFMVKDNGLYSESYTGHLITPSNGGSLMITVAVAAIVAAIAIPSLIKSKIAANESAASATLKTFNGMIATFRKKDYDNNGIRDYPTTIAALYYEVNNNQDRVTLIGIADAHADFGAEGQYTATWTDPQTGQQQHETITFQPSAKAGYWYAMIPLMSDGIPYAENRQNHYAICAFPDSYGDTGEYTFIINEEGTVYCLDRGISAPIERWPAEDPIEAGWEIAR